MDILREHDGLRYGAFRWQPERRLSPITVNWSVVGRVGPIATAAGVLGEQHGAPNMACLALQRWCENGVLFVGRASRPPRYPNQR